MSEVEIIYVSTKTEATGSQYERAAVWMSDYQALLEKNKELERRMEIIQSRQSQYVHTISAIQSKLEIELAKNKELQNRYDHAKDGIAKFVEARKADAVKLEITMGALEGLMTEINKEYLYLSKERKLEEFLTGDSLKAYTKGRQALEQIKGE